MNPLNVSVYSLHYGYYSYLNFEDSPIHTVLYIFLMNAGAKPITMQTSVTNTLNICKMKFDDIVRLPDNRFYVFRRNLIYKLNSHSSGVSLNFNFLEKVWKLKSDMMVILGSLQNCKFQVTNQRACHGILWCLSGIKECYSKEHAPYFGVAHSWEHNSLSVLYIWKF